MVTEPSVDEELVPKNEDDNGNQEILMDQVLYNDVCDHDSHDHDPLEKEEKKKEEKEEEKLMGKNSEILMDEVLEWLTHSVVTTPCNFALRLMDTQVSMLFTIECRNISSDGAEQVDGEAYVTPKEALKRKEFYMLWVTRSQNPLFIN